MKKDWKVCIIDKNYRDILAKDGTRIAIVARHLDEHGREKNASKANARLIAVAPELLDALRQIEGMCNMPEVKYAMIKHEQAYYYRVMNAVRKAISKAEG